MCGNQLNIVNAAPRVRLNASQVYQIVLYILRTYICHPRLNREACIKGLNIAPKKKVKWGYKYDILIYDDNNARSGRQGGLWWCHHRWDW